MTTVGGQMSFRELKGCARCGGDHAGLMFAPFSRPPHDEEPPITHWAICPTSGEPILLGFRDPELCRCGHGRRIAHETGDGSTDCKIIGCTCAGWRGANDGVA